MASPVSLRPHDVCVALQLVVKPEFTYRELARDVGLSLGETHNSVKRLETSRLLAPDVHRPNVTALLGFLVYGVPYVFPGELGAETQGVPTAHSGPALAGRLSGGTPIVWPSADGEVRGLALAPLCGAAPAMASSNPTLYRWMTLVDALRVGRARDRRLAHEILEEELGHRAPPS